MIVVFFYQHSWVLFAHNSVTPFSFILTLQYLMEFNSSPGDLMELSPLFSDDSRVAEAASIAQKLRKMAALSC